MLLWIPPWAAFRCWLPGDKPVSFYRFRLRVENRRGETLYRRDAPLLVRGIEPARRWFEEIVRATDPGAGSLRSWRIRAALIGLFAEAQSSKAAPAPSGRLRSRQREALEELVHRDGKVQVTPARLAAHLGLSADYFARLFRKTYGISPRAWIVRERIKMAAVRLLESHLNVGEVAGEFGYRDIFFFSRQFKQIMGQSPKHYRPRVESFPLGRHLIVTNSGGVSRLSFPAVLLTVVSTEKFPKRLTKDGHGTKSYHY